MKNHTNKILSLFILFTPFRYFSLPPLPFPFSFIRHLLLTPLLLHFFLFSVIVSTNVIYPFFTNINFLLNFLFSSSFLLYYSPSLPPLLSIFLLFSQALSCLSFSAISRVEVDRNLISYAILLPLSSPLFSSHFSGSFILPPLFPFSASVIHILLCHSPSSPPSESCTSSVIFFFLLQSPLLPRVLHSQPLFSFSLALFSRPPSPPLPSPRRPLLSRKFNIILAVTLGALCYCSNRE